MKIKNDTYYQIHSFDIHKYNIDGADCCRDDSEKSPAAAKNGKDTYDQRNDLACIGAGLNGRISAYIHFGWKNATDYIETMDVWAEFDRPFVLDDDRTIVEYTMLFDTNTTYKIVPPGGVAVYHANGGSGEMPTQVFLLGEEQALSGCGFGLPPGAAAFTGWNTAPDGSGTAYVPGQTLTPETRASFYLDLYAQWETLDWAEESGGDSPETAYLIQSAEQFDLLAQRVSSGQDYAGKHFRLTRDISVRTAVGNPSGRVRSFRGTFDGCGHDLEIDYDSGNQATAPFRCVDGAVIRNLRTKGRIAAGGKYAAGIVGRASGTTVVSNCLSSVEIASTVSGEGSHGGIVGRVSGGTTRIVGCVFEGKMLGGTTTHWGGFVGTVESGAAAEVVDGLFAPAEVTAGTAGSQTFACAANPDAVTLRNAIYARCADALATGQGRMGRSISLSGGAKFVGEERAYDTSSLMAVGDSVLCFFRKNNYYRYVYGGVGQTVALDYKPPAPRHEFAGFVATCGEEDVTATAIDGSMLTVPDADVAVSAAYLRILTPWETLQMQLDSGGTVVLTNDVAAADDESSLMVTNAVALDLNGHTITGINEKAVVLVAEGGHLTLTNSAAGGGSPVCPPGAITGGYRGVFVDWGGTFTLSGGAISDNKAGDGGGVYVADEGVFTMAGGAISGNVAEGEGGGVFVEDGGVFTMTGGTISDNVADDEGGGVFVEDGAVFTMTGGTISDNVANGSGGGVYVEISGTFKMEGGEISANSASYGGGMYVEEYGTFTLSGGVIRDNCAKWMGGGVYLDAAEMTVSGSPVISGNDTLDEDASNVCMPDGASIILAGLTAGASIGVSTESIPAWFATGATADDAAYFFSDEFGDAPDLIRIRAREFDDTWYLVLEKNYPAYLDDAYDFVIENYESWTAKYGPDTNGTHEAHFLLNIDPATPIPEGAALLKVTDFRIERGILYMELGSDVADLTARTFWGGEVGLNGTECLCNGFFVLRSGGDLSNTAGWGELDATVYPGENGRVVVVYPLNALLPYDEENDQPGPVPPSWYFLPTISIQPPGYYFPQ